MGFGLEGFTGLGFLGALEGFGGLWEACLGALRLELNQEHWDLLLLP